MLVLLSAALTIGGLVSFIMAYGLWKGKRWAWWLTIIFMIIGIALYGYYIIANPYMQIFGIVGMVINGLIGFYMSGSSVKEFFGVFPKASEATLYEMEEMRDIAPRLTQAELEDMLRDHPQMTGAQREEIREAAKVTEPTPKEEQEQMLAAYEFVKRQDVMDKEVFDLKGKCVGSVRDIAFTPSGKIGLVVSKPDKSQEVVPMDNVSSMEDIIVLRAPTTLEKPEPSPTAPPLAQKICELCNHPNKPEYRFCIRCGKRLPKSRQPN